MIMDVQNTKVKLMATKSASSAFPYSEDQTTGLTKREYFAAIALQGLLAGRNIESELSQDDWAEMAVQHADALIEALNQD